MRIDDLTNAGGNEALEVAVLAHPLIREELAQIVATGVGGEHDDHVVGFGVHGDLYRSVEREPRRPTDEDAFLARELARRHEGFAIRHLDEFVDDVPIEGARPEVLADALDLVRSDLAAVDRALGIGTDDADRGVLFLEVLPDAGDRAPGADAGHKGRDATVGLPPDLRAGRPVVRLGVPGVEVLVGLERPRHFAGEAIGNGVVRLRRLALHVGGADDHLRPVGAEQADLFRRHLVGHDEDHLVALDRRGHREPVTRVARGGLDDGAAGAEQPSAFGILEHRQTDTVLDTATRVELLELGKDQRPEPLGDLAQPDQRGVADQVEDALDVFHFPVILVPAAGGSRDAIRLHGAFVTAY